MMPIILVSQVMGAICLYVNLDWKLYVLPPSKNLESTEASELVEWASAAWKKTPEMTVEHTFMTNCGNNSFHDIEDDTVWKGMGIFDFELTIDSEASGSDLLMYVLE